MGSNERTPDMPTVTEYTVGGRIWIAAGGQAFLGLGRVRLLELVEQTGSVRQAAQSMQMSYRNALRLIHNINARATVPLVMLNQGGPGGGGASLTVYGHHAIAQYYLIQERFNLFLEEHNAGLLL
ncbi:MAG: LysR family transcriptional regulator [Desulfuromonadaceae bacterium]|nr:LysR family transcriptional regulator [Desulfuromonadaceae bacterium]